MTKTKSIFIKHFEFLKIRIESHIYALPIVLDNLERKNIGL